MKGGTGSKKLILLIILIMLSGIAVQSEAAGRDSRPREISLLQAVDLSFPEAAGWSREARLTYAVSTEAGEGPGRGSQGRDGLRPDWNIIFVEPATGRNLLVAVRQGRPAYTRELLMACKNTIDPADLKCDSTSAVKLLPLMDSYEQPTGVHFELAGIPRPILRVYRFNPQAAAGITAIDAGTGKVFSPGDSAVD